jgi:hypothetical protein
MKILKFFIIFHLIMMNNNINYNLLIQIIQFDFFTFLRKKRFHWCYIKKVTISREVVDGFQFSDQTWNRD